MARSRSSAAFCRDCCEQAARAAAMRAALSAGTSAVRIVFSPRPARANVRGREHTRTVARRSRPGVEGLLMWKAILAIGLGGALGALGAAGAHLIGSIVMTFAGIGTVGWIRG